MKSYSINYSFQFVFYGVRNDGFLNTTDPLLQAFWNKNISSMSELRYKDSTCTEYYDMSKVFIVDKFGNIVLQTSIIS